jgi:hypothetical protein
MPAAENILTLYQFEEQVEPYIKTALVTAGLASGAVFVSQSGETLQTPSTSIGLSVGQVMPRKEIVTGHTYPLFSQWNVALRFLTRTNRDANPSLHQTHRAAIRYVMNEIFSLVNALLPHHAFATVPMESGTSIGIDEENNHDVTSMNFTAVLGIKPDAWPEA